MGPGTKSWIPHSRPTLGLAGDLGLDQILSDGHVARGPVCQALEQVFCETLLQPGFTAHALQSGTLALELLLRAVVIRNPEHSRVGIPTLACAGLYHAAVRAGLEPVLLDVGPTGNLVPESLLQSPASLPNLLVVPHLYGSPVDIGPLLDTGHTVIEDCAQCLGVECGGHKVGTRGLAMMTSFYATKLLTSGQGGLVATRDKDLLEKVRDLCAYDGPARFTGCVNGDLSDWSAALVLPQLRSLPEFLDRRAELAEAYHQQLEPYADHLERPECGTGKTHAWYRYVCQTHGNADPWIAALNDRGIEAKRPVYAPLHRVFEVPGEFPQAEAHWERSLSLPLYPSLTAEEQDCVVAAIKDVAAGLAP